MSEQKYPRLTNDGAADRDTLALTPDSWPGLRARNRPGRASWQRRQHAWCARPWRHQRPSDCRPCFQPRSYADRARSFGTPWRSHDVSVPDPCTSRPPITILPPETHSRPAIICKRGLAAARRAEHDSEFTRTQVTSIGRMMVFLASLDLVTPIRSISAAARGCLSRWRSWDPLSERTRPWTALQKGDHRGGNRVGTNTAPAMIIGKSGTWPSASGTRRASPTTAVCMSGVEAPTSSPQILPSSR